MARARNIKPGFFTNDSLAECDPFARLLFAGLWTIADRAGRLEDRPKRIKAALLPYDECDVEELLNQLCVHGFIVRYEVGGQRLIQVLAFDKHQNPHKNEPESTIPAYCKAPEQNSTSTVQAPEQNSSNRADSLNLIPDSLNLIPEDSSFDVVENVPAPQPKFVFKNELKKAGVTEEAAAEFMQVRKAKKAVNTKNAFEKLVEESQKANLSLPQAIDFCLKRQKPWGAFMATWYQNEQQQVHQTYHSQNQTNPWAEYNQRVGEQFSQNEMVDVTPKKSVLIEEVGHA